MQPSTNLTENTQQKPLKIPESSHSETFTDQVQNPTLELLEKFYAISSLEQTQAAEERSRLDHQKRIEAASQF